MKDQCYSLLDDLSQALLHSSAPCWQIYPNQQSCEETKVLKKERTESMLTSYKLQHCSWSSITCVTSYLKSHDQAYLHPNVFNQKFCKVNLTDVHYVKF